jgi:hypothetical protein
MTQHSGFFTIEEPKMSFSPKKTVGKIGKLIFKNYSSIFFYFPHPKMKYRKNFKKRF